MIKKNLNHSNAGIPSQRKILGLGKRVKVLVVGEVKQLRTKRNKFRKRAHITIARVEYNILNSMGKPVFMWAHCHYHKLTTFIECKRLLEGKGWLKVNCIDRNKSVYLFVSSFNNEALCFCKIEYVEIIA